jgi:hypothetical protein
MGKKKPMGFDVLETLTPRQVMRAGKPSRQPKEETVVPIRPSPSPAAEPPPAKASSESSYVAVQMRLTLEQREAFLEEAQKRARTTGLARVDVSEVYREAADLWLARNRPR